MNNKLFSFVNVFGLVIAITLIGFLYVYIDNEKSVDQFHTSSENIYRVVNENGCAFNYPLGQYVVDNIDGVEEYLRTFSLEAGLKYKDKSIHAPRCFFVDNNFFDFFSFPLLIGDKQTVLKAKNHVVVSESFALRMFNGDNAIGKEIRYNNRLSFVVAGVVKDFDHHTHFPNPDVIFPLDSYVDVWGNDKLLTDFNITYFLGGLYVKATRNFNTEDASYRLLELLKPWYWLYAHGRNETIDFQPLHDIYLNPIEYAYAGAARSGNSKLIVYLSLIIWLLALIAGINYVNLSLASSFMRIKEICMKRLLGAGRLRVAFMSFGNTFILLGVSFALSFGALLVLTPVFNSITSYSIGFNDLLKLDYVIKIGITLLLFGLILGTAPAIFVLRAKSISLVGKQSTRIKIGLFQKGMIVTQLSISVILLISLAFITKQNSFIRNTELGFNKEQSMYVFMNSDFKNSKSAFKNELKKIPGVQVVSYCSGFPGVGIWNESIVYDNNSVIVDRIYMDENYFEALGLQVASKNTYSQQGVWLNETAAKYFNVTDEHEILTLKKGNSIKKIHVNGLIKDFNLHSLYELPRPLLLSKLDISGWVDYTLIRANTNNTKSLIKDIERTYHKFSKNFAFEYAFLEDQLNKAYAHERRLSKIIGFFSITALLLCSLGIFSLSVLTFKNKIKEVGVRKVNGAKVIDILAVLNRDFITWVLISVLPAIPLSMFFLKQWLQNFAYRTALSWWIFLGAGVFVTSIVVLSISIQSIITARQNPVEALRYE
ncbi:MAG: ABC transporter permease [Bacteroidales bacterium]|nr:ABC transporter permease [Bacteroidales bacterium]